MFALKKSARLLFFIKLFDIQKSIKDIFFKNIYVELASLISLFLKI